MPEEDLNEINESIKLLSNYHDRLKKEVIAVARKLQIPHSHINSTLEENSELIEIQETLTKLIAHRDKQLNHEKRNPLA